ncbi:MAG TPA: DUF1844 domain-containing protein [Gemmatimonadota bacterium]|nr:DUF1844 domain-containing protein [Gemmatimonadota bacterium]
MSEGEGRFRERRSAYTTEKESRPEPPSQAPQPGEALDDSRSEEAVRTPAPDIPAPEPPAGPAAPAPEPGRKVAEAAFFDVVQYIVLRASQCLGEIPLDETGERRILRVEAKQYIDLLTRLQELLRNELSAQAVGALDGVLTDLRTRYLELG